MDPYEQEYTEEPPSYNERKWFPADKEAVATWSQGKSKYNALDIAWLIVVVCRSQHAPDESQIVKCFF